MMRQSNCLLTQQQAGPHPDPGTGTSYRQPESVLLLLHRLQGGQSVEVLLHVGLLHLVVGRDQDLAVERRGPESPPAVPAPPGGLNSHLPLEVRRGSPLTG